ncbi:MAG: asparagine synthase (glutamine-hydrolyzing) [Bacteroidales bacterium]|nr:asparagine synthase (glutamine-hydrolyzing) [Bacteroidales bacterium]MCM1414579.1 asparagine synthase (glutamine-hydrolyzing) [bacterium]MCM1423872.1 asparagine synthase (glutamine-hydrolyzing) [bacterium]
MCGICGYIRKREVMLERLREMNDTMYHRGPDDSGQEIYEMKGGYHVGFAQRRLSIMDLSALGHQPMHSPDARISVVYNGEIYNFKELRKELADYPFRSECDTEVIIAAYLAWGISCVNRFNGMFAIALYDREEEAVYLIRDRIGKKPLYYWYQDEELVFASTLAPIMACPDFPARIDRRVLARFLYQKYINAPDSIYEHVCKLEPGSYLRFQGGQIETQHYWNVREAYHGASKFPVESYGEAKEQLHALLKKAVSLRMIADVPLGSFLSGGYDSSLVTALAQEVSASPVKTFSIGFAEARYNEAPYAAAVARHLGTDHTELIISEADMLALVESIPKYYDEPFADPSEIPTMLVCELAKKQVTVALSGDGGDEFFCGYNLYEKVAQAQKLDTVGALVYDTCHLPGFKQLHAFERLPFKVRVIAGNRGRETKTQFTAGNYPGMAQAMAGKQPAGMRVLPVHYPVESGYGVKDWQVRRMLLDMETYLPGDILCKMDRASMKYSLEARCPILDPNVMDFSYRIPHAYKYAAGDKKHILKEIAYDYIPRELLDRPKVGFGVPLDKWLRGPLKERLLSYTESDMLKRQNLFDVPYVQKLVKRYVETGDRGPSTGENYSGLVWAYFVFQQWYESYVKSPEI